MSELAEVLITREDFDVAVEYKMLCDQAPKAGAVVFFVGLVRDFYAQQSEHVDQALGGTIEYLELQHYPGMTESLCQEIIDEARKRFPFDAVRVVHRVGKIYAAEQIVMVAVASGHRDNAFQAAQYIMDYLKTRATLWKKEVGTQGQAWLGIKNQDLAAAENWTEK